MKRYIKANTEKPVLDNVEVIWSELEDGTGMVYEIYSGDELLFEELFDYSDVDPDAIYDSAVDMAVAVLSQKYELSDKVINQLKGQ